MPEGAVNVALNSFGGKTVESSFIETDKVSFVFPPRTVGRYSEEDVILVNPDVENFLASEGIKKVFREIVISNPSTL